MKHTFNTDTCSFTYLLHFALLSALALTLSGPSPLGRFLH